MLLSFVHSHEELMSGDLHKVFELKRLNILPQMNNMLIPQRMT